MIDWKDELGGFVYSTNKDFIDPSLNNQLIENIKPSDQELIIKLEKKGRGGKIVVIIENFKGSELYLKELAKELKNTCGTGGSVKEGLILIQGDVREKILIYLKNKGYKTKRVGG
ncbi:MAG: translation initiation factor [Solirubrobacteraceae bacterium]